MAGIVDTKGGCLVPGFALHLGDDDGREVCKFGAKAHGEVEKVGVLASQDCDAGDRVGALYAYQVSNPSELPGVQYSTTLTLVRVYPSLVSFFSGASTVT